MRSFEKRKKESHASTPFFDPKIQKKLKTGTAGDKYEVEADNVAHKVVHKTAHGSNGLLQSKSEDEVQQKPISETIISVQTKEMTEEEPVQKKKEEEKVQKKADEKEEPVQKKEMKDEEPVQKKTEEEPVQKKEMKEEEPVQKKAEENNEKLEIESRLKKTKGGGNPMSKAIKLEMENAFGADFSTIRIHTDSNAVSMCQEMKAQAFTNGSDIYFNKGKYNPNSAAGKQLLAHELTHTIQQGAVSVTHKPGSL
jgi:Domain of unknown function (DUF4157)